MWRRWAKIGSFGTFRGTRALSRHVTRAAVFQRSERMQRHVVKNSFIVEMVDNHRKLRHLFLFNDVMVCAKYKVRFPSVPSLKAGS